MEAYSSASIVKVAKKVVARYKSFFHQNMNFLSDLQLQEDGLVIPGSLPLPSPAPTHRLIAALRDRAGDPSTIMPPGSHPEQAVWLRGQCLRRDDFTPYGQAHDALRQREVDAVLDDLWDRLRTAGELEVSVQPIFVSPVYHQGDERERHYMTGRHLTHLLMSHILMVTCVSGGNNCTGLNRNFEEVSAAAMIERCVHSTRCLDLGGIRLSFKDQADEFMRSLIGAERVSTM